MKIWLLILASSSFTFAQVKPLKTIPLSRAVQQAYVDRPGDLYIELASGVLQKFDIHGNLIQEFKPPEKLSLFEPRDGARAFSYSKKSKWYSYSFFGTLNKTILKSEFAIDPILACSSGDKNIWILDQADFSLKKLNTDRATIDFEFLLPTELKSEKPENITIREYQNFLFLLHPTTGIYIFNAIGNLLVKLEGKEIPYFNFLGEELYYPQNGKLIFFDLFDTRKREKEIDASVQFMLLTDQRTYTIYSDRIEIFAINP